MDPGSDNLSVNKKNIFKTQLVNIVKNNNEIIKTAIVIGKNTNNFKAVNPNRV